MLPKLDAVNACAARAVQGRGGSRRAQGRHFLVARRLCGPPLSSFHL
jgi:hypothetical protein